MKGTLMSKNYHKSNNVVHGHKKVEKSVPVDVAPVEKPVEETPPVVEPVNKSVTFKGVGTYLVIMPNGSRKPIFFKDGKYTTSDPVVIDALTGYERLK